MMRLSRTPSAPNPELFRTPLFPSLYPFVDAMVLVRLPNHSNLTR